MSTPLPNSYVARAQSLCILVQAIFVAFQLAAIDTLSAQEDADQKDGIQASGGSGRNGWRCEG